MKGNFSLKAQYWFVQVNDWQGSGLNARQFCLREGLGYQSFLNWRRRLLSEEDVFTELSPEKVSGLHLSCGDISLGVCGYSSSRELSEVIVALSLAAQQC